MAYFSKQYTKTRPSPPPIIFNKLTYFIGNLFCVFQTEIVQFLYLNILIFLKSKFILNKNKYILSITYNIYRITTTSFFTYQHKCI